MPIFTLLRARVVGETASCPLAIPTPETEMLIAVETVVRATSTGVSCPPVLPFLANLILVVPVREMVPVFAPPAIGVKLTPRAAVCCGDRTSGMLCPVRANPGPDIAA